MALVVHQSCPDDTRQEARQRGVCQQLTTVNTACVLPSGPNAGEIPGQSKLASGTASPRMVRMPHPYNIMTLHRKLLPQALIGRALSENLQFVLDHTASPQPTDMYGKLNPTFLGNVCKLLHTVHRGS